MGYLTCILIKEKGPSDLYPAENALGSLASILQ